MAEGWFGDSLAGASSYRGMVVWGIRLRGQALTGQVSSKCWISFWMMRQRKVKLADSEPVSVFQVSQWHPGLAGDLKDFAIGFIR
ncbi:hypothetical protein B9Z31_08695 [Limnohabitans sp. G3-2]|nr:hypothetical protein B9Z31_08695 [Limnohabitans sp. G3-2]